MARKKIEITELNTVEVSIDLITSIDGKIVFSLAANSFTGSQYLKTVHIPPTVTQISADAFKNSGVKKIYITVGGHALPDGWQTGWGAEDAEIIKGDKPADVKVGAKPTSPDPITYDGNEHTNGYNPPEHVTMQEGGATKGTNAGTYSATYVLDAGYCWNDESTTAVTITLTINKAAGSITTDPTAAVDLIANGNPQDLITAAGSGTGTMEFSLTEGGTYSTTFPQGTEANEYTVWYRAGESTNYLASDARSMNVVIRYEWDTYPVTEAEMNALPLSWGYIS